MSAVRDEGWMRLLRPGCSEKAARKKQSRAGPDSGTFLLGEDQEAFPQKEGAKKVKSFFFFFFR